ncbi:MAG TPA: OmpA family protein [Myxococcales bacterium]|nr:OmpA family protein [Myxococcales bacterium]
MRSVPFVSVCLLALAACSHTQPPPAPPPAQIIAEPAPPPPAPAAPKPPPDVAPVSLYFDYNTSELSEATRAALQSFFDQARQRSDRDVRIEGNCDERGSREYNLALGQRRAEAAKSYLENLGLESTRVTTVSNGKEHPKATGHDEASWKENRRDDLIPTDHQIGVSSVTDPSAR